MCVMRPASFGLVFMGFAFGAVLFIAASMVLAWTGPVSAPPNGNVAAPINIGSASQLKNGGLGVNFFTIFGDALLSGLGSGTGRYINFDYTIGGTSGTGSGGYGFRDNNGVMEFRNSGGSWTPSPTSGGGSSGNTNFTISSDTSNVNLYVLAGSPSTAGTYTVTINSGITVGSASAGTAALVSGTWPAGSTVLLINNGNIYGRGGDGGAGGSSSSIPCGVFCSQYPAGAGGAGGAGGPAMSLSYNITINNTSGNIFGGGGGGGGGTGQNGAGGNGGGGGQGSMNSSGGGGGGGTNESGGSGSGGTTSGPGAPGSGGGQFFHGPGGTGGAWASAGATPSGGASGGAAGGAIQLNGKTVTFLGGNDATHVKGAVQ